MEGEWVKTWTLELGGWVQLQTLVLTDLGTWGRLL